MAPPFASVANWLGSRIVPAWQFNRAPKNWQRDVVWILALQYPIRIPWISHCFHYIPIYSFYQEGLAGFPTTKRFGHPCLSHKHRWLVVSHVSTSKITISLPISRDVWRYLFHHQSLPPNMTWKAPMGGALQWSLPQWKLRRLQILPLKHIIHSRFFIAMLTLEGNLTNIPLIGHGH